MILASSSGGWVGPLIFLGFILFQILSHQLKNLKQKPQPRPTPTPDTGRRSVAPVPTLPPSAGLEALLEALGHPTHPTAAPTPPPLPVARKRAPSVLSPNLDSEGPSAKSAAESAENLVRATARISPPGPKILPALEQLPSLSIQAESTPASPEMPYADISAQTTRDPRAASWRRRLQDHGQAREALILAEIFGPAAALR